MSIAGGQILTVNALGELRLLTAVALGAGHGHVVAEDRRSEVPGTANVMGAMAIRADRGFVVSGGYQLAVYGFLISKRWLACHTRHRLSVALAAHLGNINLGRTGLGVAGRQDFMNIAVAALAICGFYVARGERLPVNSVVVHLLFVGMAGDASRLDQPCIVRQALNVGMAIYAGEHGAVNRRLKCVSMHVLAVDHRGIAVTGKAIIVSRLGLGGCLGPCVRKPGAEKHQAHHPDQF